MFNNRTFKVRIQKPLGAKEFITTFENPKANTPFNREIVRSFIRQYKEEGHMRKTSCASTWYEYTMEIQKHILKPPTATLISVTSV